MNDGTTTSVGEQLPLTAQRLHPLESSDLPFFRSLAQDERVTRYIGDGTPWSDELVRSRFDDALGGGGPDREVRWYIAESDTAGRLGLLALTKRPSEIEIGYWIAPARWGEGHATRLLTHGLRLARQRKPDSLVVAHVHRDNTASRRLLEHAGFTIADPDKTDNSTEVTYLKSRPAPALEARRLQ